jgi:hypothetical protein
MKDVDSISKEAMEIETLVVAAEWGVMFMPVPRSGSRKGRHDEVSVRPYRPDWQLHLEIHPAGRRTKTTATVIIPFVQIASGRRRHEVS